MDRTPNSTTEVVYDRETHMYAMYLGGELVGFAHTYVDADATLAELHPPYPLLLDAAADPPIDEPPPVPPGQGGDDPERGPYSDEYLAEIDHLCRCADGEFILDWAMVDALEAHVRRALRDLPPAATPDSPAPSPLQPAPVGSSAAKAAYLARADKARTRWQELSEDSGRLAVWHGGRVLAYAANIVQVRRLRERLAEVA